jgi:ferric-dicitrate binding protein FerR (iron transport regulator)
LTESRPIIRSNGKGQTSKISLPDGSTVWLNAGSSIEYPENFSDTLRKIKLIGEAYFDVHKDSLRPFIVEAGHLKTTVLGTSFNISNYAEDEVAEVSLVTGKLNVVQENNSEILLPGNEVLFNKSNSHFMKHSVDINKMARWKEGILVFDHEALHSVVAQLERWYDIRINFSGEPLPDWKFTGTFDNESLRNVLEVLCFGKNLNYKIKNKEVTLIQQN